MFAVSEAALKPSMGEKGALLSMHKLPGGPDQGRKTVTVRLADSDGQRTQASILVNRMYAWRGYGADHKLSCDQHRVTFTACFDNTIVGTLSLGVDGENGLAADDTFKDELDAFRRHPGSRLCELTKFACDPATKSHAALAALFHVIFIYGTQRFGCTDLFIEVHPRHVRFYEALLNFKRIGCPRVNPDITWWPADVPVQLMWLRIADIRRAIDEHAGRKGKGARSLYPLFFTPEQERSVCSRIAELGAESNRSIHWQHAQGRSTGVASLRAVAA